MGWVKKAKTHTSCCYSGDLICDLRLFSVADERRLQWWCCVQRRDRLFLQQPQQLFHRRHETARV